MEEVARNRIRDGCPLLRFMCSYGTWYLTVLHGLNQNIAYGVFYGSIYSHGVGRISK
jgi:hypothetical protein